MTNRTGTPPEEDDEKDLHETSDEVQLLMSETKAPTKTETEAVAAYEAALKDCGVGILALIRTDAEWAKRLSSRS